VQLSQERPTKKDMKKILCPTDFSETAHNAIAYAAKLAKATNCELTLLNVQSMFDFTPVELVRGKEMAVAGISAQLEAQSMEVAKTFKISCYAEVEPTFRALSKVINDKAKHYDLIVMGTDGPDDLYQFFEGSNTYNAIVKSDTPVLLIPTGYVYCEIKSIVYAFDYLSERALPLTRLIPFIKATGCELTVLQVMEEAYSKEAEDELKELQFIIRNLHGEDLNYRYRYDTIRSAEIASSINSYISRNQSDALALCTTHRNLVEKMFHKSIIKNISAICHYPLYVFHQ
jgi:nucleotide-binding universal stress UspA family protein